MSYNDSGVYYGQEISTTGAPAYRHDGGANVVYWDGHARFIKREKIAKDTADLNKPQWDLSK